MQHSGAQCSTAVQWCAVQHSGVQCSAVVCSAPYSCLDAVCLFDRATPPLDTPATITITHTTTAAAHPCRHRRLDCRCVRCLLVAPCHQLEANPLEHPLLKPCNTHTMGCTLCCIVSECPAAATNTVGSGLWCMLCCAACCADALVCCMLCCMLCRIVLVC